MPGWPFHGRLLIVRRHRAGWKQAHIAAAMGVSRKCVRTWIDRYAAEGEAGLQDRSSRPHSMPTRTPAEVEQRVLQGRREHRRGQDWLGAELGVPARTVSRILRRHRVPHLRECDPMTGQVIRASKSTAVRYERQRPGELVHMDVKKLGKIPDGGGWRAHGRGPGDNRNRRQGTGYDYVHSLVDDYSRLAYSEILPDEKGTTCAAFLTRAAAYFAEHGIAQIERLLTDNAFAYRHSLAGAGGLCRHRRQAEVHQAALPLAERQGGKVQPHPAGRVGLPAGLHQQRRPRRRPCALARVLQQSTPPQRTRRATPDQPPVTNVPAGYN
jgi:transposase